MKSQSPKLRHDYRTGPRVQVDFTDAEQLTDQTHADELDINTVMRRWANGTEPIINAQIPKYGDFSNVDDYLVARLNVAEVQDSFDKLPHAVRAKFNFEPHELLAFVDNPDNYDEAIRLGLLEPNPALKADLDPTPAPPPSGDGESPTADGD